MIFDFHFHLLLKHILSGNTNIDQTVTTKGIGGVLNELMGGAFDSQSAPSQIAMSDVKLGVVALITLEYAFTNRILNIAGIDLSGVLPLDQELVSRTKAGETSYFNELDSQLTFYLNSLQGQNIQFLNRSSFQGKSSVEIKTELERLFNDGKRCFVYSIEGGHNLSDVPTRDTNQRSLHPELNLQKLQERTDCDFLSINLTHLSEIPEQPLCGFAHGVNKIAGLAFSSEDFYPSGGLGLTELGKKVIRQALTHETKPILIDVKHMSVYSRFDFYRYREYLNERNPQIGRLPIISSHSGFTFTTLQELMKGDFSLETEVKNGKPLLSLRSKNRKIGHTDDFINSGLYANPWTLNLFDEEIVEIMRSGGLIGIIMDQRVLGASQLALDSARGKYFEAEYMALEEARKLFVEKQIPTSEGLLPLEGLHPPRTERHIMLFCLHIIHAVRVGYAYLPWIKDQTSPWDHLCLGSDYDGLINPINGFEDVTQLVGLKGALLKYLPQADKTLPFYKEYRALRYHDGYLDKDYLEEVVEKFLSKNGLEFMIRFLRNWQ